MVRRHAAQHGLPPAPGDARLAQGSRCSAADAAGRWPRGGLWGPLWGPLEGPLRGHRGSPTRHRSPCHPTSHTMHLRTAPSRERQTAYEVSIPLVDAVREVRLREGLLSDGSLSDAPHAALATSDRAALLAAAHPAGGCTGAPAASGSASLRRDSDGSHSSGVSLAEAATVAAAVVSPSRTPLDSGDCAERECGAGAVHVPPLGFHGVCGCGRASEGLGGAGAPAAMATATRGMVADEAVQIGIPRKWSTDSAGVSHPSSAGRASSQSFTSPPARLQLNGRRTSANGRYVLRSTSLHSAASDRGGESFLRGACT